MSLVICKGVISATNEVATAFVSTTFFLSRDALIASAKTLASGEYPWRLMPAADRLRAKVVYPVRSVDVVESFDLTRHGERSRFAKYQEKLEASGWKVNRVNVINVPFDCDFTRESMGALD